MGVSNIRGIIWYSYTQVTFANTWRSCSTLFVSFWKPARLLVIIPSPRHLPCTAGDPVPFGAMKHCGVARLVLLAAVSYGASFVGPGHDMRACDWAEITKALFQTKLHMFFFKCVNCDGTAMGLFLVVKYGSTWRWPMKCWYLMIGVDDWCWLEVSMRYLCIMIVTIDPDSTWLVVWNMNFIFPSIGNVIIPTDEVIFFRGVCSTTNQ